MAAALRRVVAPLFALVTAACGSGEDDEMFATRDAGVGNLRHDAGPPPRDAGFDDAGNPRDAGPRDAGATHDAGPRDAGATHDAGPRDAGATRDAGPRDAGVPRDAGPPPHDAGPRDGGVPRDAGFPDAGFPDSGTPDSGTPDAGPVCSPAATMTFFFTEQGSGAMGGNLGGLAGADAICQAAATAAGAGGRTWRAYLSTLADATYGRVDARDRIGAGPWFNYDGVSIGSHAAIHHEMGGLGIPANLQKSECGYEITQDMSATLFARAHDILTGSDSGGRLVGGTDPVTDPPLNCDDWTSSSSSDTAWIGHEDTDFSSGFWNDAHPTVGCDQGSFAVTLSIGRLYCFAIN